VRQLEIKVLDIVDARCNHEVSRNQLLFVPSNIEVKNGWTRNSTLSQMSSSRVKKLFYLYPVKVY